MAAHQPPGGPVANDGSRSEDEDSNIGIDLPAQFPVDNHFVRLFTVADETALTNDDWTDRPQSPWSAWNYRYYVPPWTRPDHDDNIEVKSDGSQQRPPRGDIWGRMRPAILPTDPPATQYAQRFGIHPNTGPNPPDVDPNDGYAHSMLTPTLPSAAAPGPGDGDDQQSWRYRDSFQAYIFDGFTADELRDIGALDLGQNAQLPNLQGDLFPLLRREKWTQTPITTDFSTRNLQSWDCWYNLNGQHKQYNVQLNDELWDALQPSLQYTSKVLQSGHPCWNALLSLYHLQPVPIEKDGRTQAEKAAPDYLPYMSVWLNIDRNKMYDGARALMDSNFDSSAAAMEVLNRLLYFSITTADNHHFAETTPWVTTAPGQLGIRINISAATVWPLLANQYSSTEKIAVSFTLAGAILHELAHAARMANALLVHDPGVLGRPTLWTPPDGTAWDMNIIGHLRGLQTEAFGPYWWGKDYIFQDEIQAEDGKHLEKQLWGFTLGIIPYVSSKKIQDYYRPVVTAVEWPWPHPKVHLQNQRAVDAGLYGPFTSGGYRTYLLDPPAPVFRMFTPLPLRSFAGFFQDSWWQTEFARFGHQASRIPIHSTDPRFPSKSIIGRHNMGQVVTLLTSVITSENALRFILNHAVPRLEEQNQPAILDYLHQLTLEAAAAKILRNRLHYEKRTWPQHLQPIQDLSLTCTQDFNAIWNDVQQEAAPPLSDNAAVAITNISTRLRGLLRNVSELSRLLGVQVQYSQGLAAQYLLQSVDARRVIHRRYMAPLRQNLQQMSNAVSDTLNRLMSDHNQNGQLVWDTLTAPWEARLTFTLQGSALSGMNWALVQTAIDAVADIRSQAEIVCSLMRATMTRVSNLLLILDVSYVEYAIGSAPVDVFPGVPFARKMMTTSKSLESAAIWAIIRLNNPSLLRLVQQWRRIVLTQVGSAPTGTTNRLAILQERMRTEIEAFVTFLFEVKAGPEQQQPMVVPPGFVNTGAGFPAVRASRLAWVRQLLRNTISDHAGLRARLRDLCRQNNDEDEFRTIMALPQNGPMFPTEQQLADQAAARTG